MPMTKFQKFALAFELGVISGNIWTMLWPGYYHTAVAAAVAVLVFFVGPHIEIWLVEHGWL